MKMLRRNELETKDTVQATKITTEKREKQFKVMYKNNTTEWDHHAERRSRLKNNKNDIDVGRITNVQYEN